DTLRLGDGVGTGALTVASYAHRPTEGDALYQAALSSCGDAACLTVLLAPNDQSHSWASIDAELARAEPESPATDLGNARIYLGLVDGPVDRGTAEAVAPLLGAQVPGARDGAWTRRPSLTAAGFLLWEAPPTRPDQRRLVLVGPAEAEAELDAFSWTPGGGQLGAFVQYLLDSAKLRQQSRIYQASSAGIRRLRQQTDDAVTSLLALHRATPVTATDLVTADAELAQLQVSSTGVITTHARLRKVARSADAALGNLRRLAPLAPGWQGPLADDQTLGEALRERVADDITELEIARDQAERVSALTAAAVQRGVGAAQQQLMLVQASVVGSILMVLAALQAFGAKLPIPSSLQTPLILFLGSLALALPTAVLRWSRRVPQDLPLRTVDYVTAFLTGASAGWLGGTAVSRLGYGRLLPVTWTLAVSLAAGLVAVGLAQLRIRSVRAAARAHVRQP
ncbi:MAG TPA: CATRA conflict system CASPASE/TPR repeat-associated protein, partial [Micromonospora sp.]